MLHTTTTLYSVVAIKTLFITLIQSGNYIPTRKEVVGTYIDIVNV